MHGAARSFAFFLEMNLELSIPAAGIPARKEEKERPSFNVPEFIYYILNFLRTRPYAAQNEGEMGGNLCFLLSAAASLHSPNENKLIPSSPLVFRIVFYCAFVDDDFDFA